MNFSEYRFASHVRLTDTLSVPLVQPLEIDEPKGGTVIKAILAGRTSEISPDTSGLLFSLAAFRGNYLIPGRDLWKDLYAREVPYDAQDLFNEVATVNNHFRIHTVYPLKGGYNRAGENDLIAIDKTGRGYSYALPHTEVYSKQALDESYRRVNSNAFARIPLTPVEAGVVVAAVLDNRSGRLPFVGPYALPGSINNWFKEAPIRSIGGISNQDLEMMRYEAYAKVISHPDHPDSPFNDALLELQEFIASMERGITRSAVIEALRPESRESFTPIYGRK